MIEKEESNFDDYYYYGCYCDEDQGAGYTYHDEHGDCEYCLENSKEDK